MQTIWDTDKFFISMTKCNHSTAAVAKVLVKMQNNHQFVPLARL